MASSALHMKTTVADPLMDQMLHRFLEIILEVPFEPWTQTGREFIIVILAYTILLAYGKLLSAICMGVMRTGRYLVGWRRRA